MKSVIRNIYGSFLPARARKELFEFLSANKYIKGQIAHDIALKRLAAAYQLAGERKEPSREDIRKYIIEHEREIQEECNLVLQKLARECLPGFNWAVILKHVGLFAICVVPAIIFLVADILEKIQQSMVVPPQEALALLFLVILLTAVGVALILDSARDKN